MLGDQRNGNFVMFTDDEIHTFNVNPCASRTWNIIVATDVMKPASVKPIRGHDCTYFVMSNIDT